MLGIGWQGVLRPEKDRRYTTDHDSAEQRRSVASGPRNAGLQQVSQLPLDTLGFIHNYEYFREVQ